MAIRMAMLRILNKVKEDFAIKRRNSKERVEYFTGIIGPLNLIFAILDYIYSAKLE